MEGEREQGRSAGEGGDSWEGQPAFGPWEGRAGRVGACLRMRLAPARMRVA